jgi:hypothetical protein
MSQMLVAKPVESPGDDHEDFLGTTSAHPFERTFRKVDFTEDPNGVVRVNAPLSHELDRALALVRERLAPLGERMAADGTLPG